MSFTTNPFAFSSTNGMLPAIRWYTEFDPYHITVDNRPLSDLKAAIDVAGIAADGARINLGNTQMALAVTQALSQSFSGGGFVQGLAVKQGAANEALVGPGVLFSPETVSGSRTALFMALNGEDRSISVTAPATAGQERWILIQGKYIPMATSTVGSLPFMDTANASSSQANLIGSLQLTTKAGSDAATGAAVRPSVDVGFVAIAYVKMSAGSTNITGLVYGPGRGNKPGNFADLRAPAATPATKSEVNFHDVYTMDKASATSILFEHRQTEMMNGMVDLRLHGQATATGVIGYDISYRFILPGGSLSGATNTTVSTQKLSFAAANVYEAVSLGLAIAPPSGAYGIIGKITRITTGDTNAGNMQLIGVQVVQ